MQNGLKIVLDLSNNDLGTIDPACFKAHGVDGVYLGTFSRTNAPRVMADVAESCKQGGLEIWGFYGLPYYGDSYGETRDIRWAIDLAREFNAPRVIIDTETDAYLNGWIDAAVPSPAHRNDVVEQLVGEIQAKNLNPWIYTYAGWWYNQHANTTRFNHLPLLLAAYGVNDGTQPPIKEFTTFAIGGWTRPSGHQYTSEWGLINGCGRSNRDANYIFNDEEEMSPKELELLLAIATVLNGAPTGVDFNTVDDALTVYRPLVQNDVIEMESLQNLNKVVTDLKKVVDDHLTNSVIGGPVGSVNYEAFAQVFTQAASAIRLIGRAANQPVAPEVVKEAPTISNP